MGCLAAAMGRKGACGLSIAFLTPPGQEQGAKQQGKAELLCRWGQQGSAVLRRSNLRWLCAAAIAMESLKEMSQLCSTIRPEKKVLEAASLH